MQETVKATREQGKQVEKLPYDYGGVFENMHGGHVGGLGIRRRLGVAIS
jgi:hypothetical protein